VDVCVVVDAAVTLTVGVDEVEFELELVLEDDVVLAIDFNADFEVDDVVELVEVVLEVVEVELVAAAELLDVDVDVDEDEDEEAAALVGGGGTTLKLTVAPQSARDNPSGQHPVSVQYIPASQ